MSTQPEFSTLYDEQGELLNAEQFAIHLLRSLAASLANQFADSSIAQDGTQPLIYEFEDPEYGHIEISDYYNRAHKDERLRSYLRKPTLVGDHLSTQDATPIINFGVGDTQYAIFRTIDVDKTKGLGQLLTQSLPMDIDPNSTIVTKSLQLVEHPEEDPVLQWLTRKVITK